MFEWIEQIFTGIFTEPTTSVVAILLGVIAFLGWLLLRTLKENKETHNSMVEELKKSYNYKQQVLQELAENKQLTTDNKVKVTEAVAMMNQLSIKFDGLRDDIKKGTER